MGAFPGVAFVAFSVRVFMCCDYSRFSRVSVLRLFRLSLGCHREVGSLCSCLHSPPSLLLPPPPLYYSPPPPNPTLTHPHAHAHARTQSKYNREHRTQVRGAVEVTIVPYSEHSNFDELCSFVSFLKPRQAASTRQNLKP